MAKPSGSDGNSSDASSSTSTSSSSNGGRPHHKHDHTQGRDILEDAQVFDTFAGIIREKFTRSDNVKRLDKMYNDPAYASEKRLIAQMNNNGLWKGVGLGVATFAFLRMGPSVTVRFLTRKRGVDAAVRPPSGTTTLNSPFNNGGLAQQSQQRGPGGSAPQPGGAGAGGDRRAGFLLRFLRFGLDAFVGLSVAAYGSVFFTDRKKLLRDMSEIPLVPGRSLISDELCSDFVTEYERIPKHIWKYHEGRNRNGKETTTKYGDPISAISNFVTNCQKRNEMERRIREESGYSPNEPVSIPSPGVPHDIDYTIEDGGEDEERVDFADDYFGTSDTDPSGGGGGEGDDDSATKEWTSIDDFDKKK